MLSAELDQQPQGSSSSVLMRSIMNYAEQHLGDPDLGPGKIAAQHFISPRYLQMLFQRNGLTVTSWVRERRLERCRRDLEDPALAGETVATLAAKWGFFEATNFSRAFKRQFGLSPRAVRSLDPAAMTTR
ncbi:helix-turn-helix domain-containing protein [Leucobacter exalbidus]